jgi:hypothetical protein
MTAQQESFHMDDDCIDNDATEFGLEYCDSDENVDEDEVEEEYEDAEPSSSSQSLDRHNVSTSSKKVSAPSQKAVGHENVDEDEDEVEEEYEDAEPSSSSQSLNGCKASTSSKKVSAPSQIAVGNRKRKKEEIIPAVVREKWTTEMPFIRASTVKLVGAKLRSSVWTHYKKLAPLPVTAYNPMHYASCNICHQEALNDNKIRFLIKCEGSTTKLRRHLLAQHAHIIVAEEEEQAALIVSEESSQKTMMAFLCDNSKSDHLYLYLKWICVRSRPISICMDEEFVEMQEGLKKGYHKLDRHTVTNKLRSVSAVVKEILILMMDGQHVALTTDHWSSVANTTFMAVTAHFIDENWELVSLTLGCSEHVGETSAVECEKELEYAVTRYKLNLSKTAALVTDSEATMTLMGRSIPCAHHYCLAHILDLTTVSSLFFINFKKVTDDVCKYCEERTIRLTFFVLTLS